MSETRPYNELYDRNFAENTNIDLNIDKTKGLKPIPKNIKSKAILNSVEYICNKNNLKVESEMISGIQIITIFGFPKVNTEDLNEDQVTEIMIKQSEPYLNQISEHLTLNLSKIIEQETGESANKYFRTCTLFESTVQKECITLTWS